MWMLDYSLNVTGKHGSESKLYYTKDESNKA